MRKILLVLILVLIISPFNSNAADIASHLFLTPPGEIPEWGRALKTRPIPELERYTFLVIPLNPKEAVYLITLVDWTNLPIEFQNLSGAIQERMIPSILLTQAYEQGYRIQYVIDNYVILAKSIYKKDQQEKQ